MSRAIDALAAAELLRGADDIMIVTHKNPDGDTLGAGFAMRAAFEAMGKRAFVATSGKLSEHYGVMTGRYKNDEPFAPKFVLSVDVAAPNMFGDEYKEYAGKTDLCIDHHGTNAAYAEAMWCDSGSASCCEMIAELLDILKVEIDKYIAACIYIGLSTDTGCFKYSNTTAATHRTAARLIDIGIDVGALNFMFFEERPLRRLILEQAAIAGLEVTCHGRIALMTVTKEMLEKTGCGAGDLEGITPIPRTIEGVEAGVTLRETGDNFFKVSLRTKTIDASKICAKFGGGGHPRASGFECSGTQFDVKCAVVAAIEAELDS